MSGEMKEKRFNELSNSFSKLLKELKDFMKAPSDMNHLCGEGTGVQTALKLINKDNDFPGCYVMIEDGQPFYVGISKRVISRLQNHVKGKTHNSSSLAYNIARKNVSEDKDMSRADFVEKYPNEFNEAIKRISEMKIAWVKIEDPILLYVFEVYAAIELETLEYNSFETH